MWALVVIPVLYWWLSGHWFGRVLAFIFWVPVVVVGPAKMIPNVNLPPDYGAAYGLFMLACCMVIAWLIASLPLYIKARHLRADSAARSSMGLVAPSR